MNRIDKAVRAPGLIRRALTYSLVVNQDGLYVISTGPASQNVGYTAVAPGAAGFGVAAKAGFDAMYGPQVEVGEARLASESLAKLATEKNNFFFPLNQITEATVDQNHFGEVCLNLRAGKEKLKFACRANNQAEVEVFAKVLKP